MQLLPRKGTLAIAAVLDIALNARGQPVAAKALASRHHLPPRYLEPVLQTLVRLGILRGVRGPRGGYELARDQRDIRVDEILRAAGTTEEQESPSPRDSVLLTDVVMPALAEAEKRFAAALAQITVADLARSVQGLKKAVGDD